MTYVFFITTWLIPLLHLQFGKNLVKKRGKEFGWNWDTFSALYTGAISGIGISSFFMIAEYSGVDVKIGAVGYIFAILSFFLVYEFYIQKSID